MATEIINSLRAKSTVVITGNTATTVTLSQLKASATETVTGAEIAQASGTTDGVWSVYRGDSAAGTLAIQIVGNLSLVMYEFDVSLANNATANLYITNSGTAGTLILQLAKTATYTVDTGKL